MRLTIRHSPSTDRGSSRRRLVVPVIVSIIVSGLNQILVVVVQLIEIQVGVPVVHVLVRRSTGTRYFSYHKKLSLLTCLFQYSNEIN